MRILSWNINGIRTLPQYHPWNTFKSCEAILDELAADVICFQEMKSSRAALTRDVAVPEKYTSFFSFPASKGGYSGVAVYTKSRTVVPLKAEEGLSGKLQPKPRLSLDERISPTYPSADDINAFPDEHGDVPITLDALDAEGRALVLDFGLFVLINVYCPNETSDERLSFKMNYHLMLAERVRRLVEDEKRDVIVVGDLNICAAPLDHGDGHLPSHANVFWEHPARAWFRQWLEPHGPMIDVVRTFWPERRGMFTCWNMKIGGRESNYGSRVDYILVTRGLLPWIKHGDIQPALKGSDHCPIYIDLHDEITLDSGESVKLRDKLRQREGKQELPRIAAQNWQEFSGKQQLLSSFFGTKGNGKSVTQPEKKSPSATPPETPAALAPSATTSLAVLEPIDESAIVPPTNTSQQSNAGTSRITSSNSSVNKKRKSTEALSTTSTAKKKKKQTGQATLATFFSKPSTQPSTASKSADIQSNEVIDLIDGAEEVPADDPPPTCPPDPHQDPDTLAQLDADYRLALELSASEGAVDELASSAAPGASSLNPCSSESENQSQNKAAWSSLFTPVQAPRCTAHGEPTKRYTVNKPGPNKGRTFYLCSRPVGPGYDKGKSQRLREEVNQQYRCNYFKWTSDLKREQSANNKSGS